MAIARDEACMPLAGSTLIKVLPRSVAVAERFVGPLQAAMTRFALNPPADKARRS